MADKKSTEPAVPVQMKPAYDSIVALTDDLCQQHLNEEYAALCRKMAGALARKRPSPLERGKPQVWACAILRVIGRVNFLDDKTQTPHMKMTDLDVAFGISTSTGSAKAKAINDLLKVRVFDPKWTLPSKMDDNPMLWMIQVDGLIMDVRQAPRAIQEEAFRLGLIPYVPGEPPQQGED